MAPSAACSPMVTTRSNAGSSVPLRAKFADVVDPKEVGRRDEETDISAAKYLRSLATLESSVDRDQRGTGHRQAEIGDDPLDAVRGPDRHPVTGLDPCSDQRCSKSAGCVVEFAERHLDWAVDDRGPLSEASCGGGHQPRDRLLHVWSPRPMRPG